MTTASEHVLALGRRVLEPYARLPGVACAAITGSSTEGLSDEHSDLDTTVYYDAFPLESEIRATRERVGGSELVLNMGSYADGEFLESYRVDGIEVQIGHTTVAVWERDMRRTLAGEEPGSPLHKAMSGTLISIAVSGEERLESWKREIRAYPEALRVAMVKHHLRFFPIWGVIARLETRDAGLWIRQALVDSSFNILGVLAGVNWKYFTSFQFKRSTTFIDSLTVAPAGLGKRLEGLWHVPPRTAAHELKNLVADTVEIVEREMPAIDTGAVRKALRRDDRAWEVTPGARHSS